MPEDPRKYRIFAEEDGSTPIGSVNEALAHLKQRGGGSLIFHKGKVPNHVKAADNLLRKDNILILEEDEQK